MTKKVEKQPVKELPFPLDFLHAIYGRLKCANPRIPSPALAVLFKPSSPFAGCVGGFHCIK